jgi:ABC-2 type transport system ATP-binding protein
MVSINNLTFAYKKEEDLLSGLNLELKKGKVYGLFGLNGAGKTTLLNLISGMLFPASGHCTIAGEDTMQRSPEIMNRLFIMPEQFELPEMTGEKFTELHNLFYPRFNDNLFKNCLEEFEVNLSKKLPELSYGQQKKFLIAFAIGTETELLIFDEPTNGLDIPSKSQFRKIVAALDFDSRCVLISTHQARDLGSMIDHITVLKDGSVVFNHSLNEVINRLSIQKISEEDSRSYLYGEEVLGGIRAILPSSGSNSEEFDLELLFNGIIQKTDEINQQFAGVSS